MADLITELELNGLREDFNEMMGTAAGRDAKMTIEITRVTSSTVGEMDEDTLQYPDAVPSIIYSGEAYISPIVFRRDRQEIAGGETVRIRQYRCLLPWDAPNIELDDVVKILTSSDPHFAGRILDVTDVMFEAELAARRITLTDTGASDGNTENC